MTQDMDTQSIIIRPIITEKALALADKGKFAFEVYRFADKPHIKKAVESRFNVHVVNISTSIVKGKSKRTGTKRTEVKQSPRKKALVTLKKGEKIEFFETGTK